MYVMCYWMFEQPQAFFIIIIFAVYPKTYCSNQVQGIKKTIDLHDQNTYPRQN